MNFTLQNLLLPQRKQGEVKDILLKKYKKKNDKTACLRWRPTTPLQ
jgi:hypothetical protein